MYSAIEGVTDTFFVEVSGWDSSDMFFVEHALLSWSGNETKEIVLRNVVRRSDTVFVRLMQLVEGSENFPVACQVTKLSEKDADGRVLVEAEERRPHAPFRETVEVENAPFVTSAVSPQTRDASRAADELGESSRGLDRIPL